MIASAPETPRIGCGDVEHDALHDRRDVGRSSAALELGRELVAGGRVGVEVDVDDLALRVLRGAARDRARDVVEVLRVDERRGEVVAAAAVLVAGGDVGGAVAGDAVSRTA